MFLFVEYIVEQEEWNKRFGLVFNWLVEITFCQLRF